MRERSREEYVEKEAGGREGRVGAPTPCTEKEGRWLHLKKQTISLQRREPKQKHHPPPVTG
jgi:hypothetical protein